ncbi:MAG: hypothetical protein GFH27_549293n251 [Chloroflexi bacterium AL-W]|nr:hypothetical protein [Chloroflexi bacterium AL-N1]NOK67634.1 hypothetical protein [Chloroflexi bacterium AL-N10]NOK75596.1 hypothetical protein [Chloroflexi bacterium AL-N5]NOK82384.1 hypothetical protein [Chloroflexi bacterium AL-W]NOK90229.1 hypothetical protein [Chloroflexi bacterium AL-N15]
MDNKLASALHRSAKPGEIITFGTYPQMADASDTTPIKWRVLQNSGKDLFMLSEYILDCKQYHGEFTDITWCDCDLRKWLNNEFYNVAFNADEKGFVKTTRCTDNGEDSPDTEDKVFLLSVTEVHERSHTLDTDFRRTRGTEFAKIKKAGDGHLYVMDKHVDTDYINEGGKKYGCSWWWLRSQGRLKDTGHDPSRAVFIGTRASIRHYARVNRTGYGVRPALKLDLQH